MDPLTTASLPVDDGTIISGLQAMDPWQADLGYPNRTKIGLLNACGNMSGFVVGPIITWIDEKYGRKWGIRCELLASGGRGVTCDLVKAD
jgi:hypothetical protein